MLEFEKFVEDSGSANIESSVLETSRTKRRVLSEVLDDSAK